MRRPAVNHLPPAPPQKRRGEEENLVNKKKRGGALFVFGLLTGACATVPAGPSVMALPGKGRSFDAFQGDDLVCRQWASQQAGTSPERAGGLATAERAGVGTLIGAGL